MLKPTLFLALLMTIGCSGDGFSSGSRESILGYDFTGNYKYTSFECFQSSSPFSATQSSLVGSADSFTYIDGNTFKSVISDADCSVEIEGEIIFTSSDAYLLNETKVVSATGGSCTISYDLSELNGGAPNFTASSIDKTYTVGPIANSSYFYTRNKSTGAIGTFFTGVGVQGSSDDCFLIMTKF